MASVNNLNAYIYQMARNTLYSYLEAGLKRDTLPINEVTEMPDLKSLEEEILAGELENLIDLVIEKMPPQRKAIYLLSRKEGVKK